MAKHRKDPPPTGVKCGGCNKGRLRRKALTTIAIYDCSNPDCKRPYYDELKGAKK